MTNELSESKKMGIRSFATFIEIAGGQPLDRWKMNLQLPPKSRLSMTQLLKLGPSEFYSASTTSILQRSILYIPSIYIINDYCDKNINNDLIKPFLISAFVTPQVSIFESLKTDQQIKNVRNINLMKIYSNKLKINGINGVFPSPVSTFLREASFSAGICIFTPIINNKLDTINNNSYNSFLGGMISGFITQLISQPFDTIKSRQEYKYKNSFIKTIKLIYKENGVKSFFLGTTPRCIRGMWTLGCLSYITTNLTDYFNQ